MLVYICFMKYEFKECIGVKLRNLSRMVDYHFREALEGTNITENQMSILFVLHSSGQIEQGKLGDFLFLKRSTVSRNIKLLEKMELVTRSVDYRPIVELSEEGKTLVNRLAPIWEGVMSDLITKIGEKGVADINQLTKKMK